MVQDTRDRSDHGKGETSGLHKTAGDESRAELIISLEQETLNKCTRRKNVCGCRPNVKIWCLKAEDYIWLDVFYFLCLITKSSNDCFLELRKIK